jgi:hypothetical protein
MVFHDLTVDGTDHRVFMKTSKKKAYTGLSKALLENLNDNQLKNITTVNRNNKNIIFFHDLINCFEPIGQLKSNSTCACICGKTDITDLYYIRNIADSTKYIIGSTCARNWFKEEREGQCSYCSRVNKNLGDCINCAGKKLIKSVITTWKNFVMKNKEKVTFGKRYVGMTYVELCRKHKDYVTYCLSDACNMEKSKKINLQYFANRA